MRRSQPILLPLLLASSALWAGPLSAQTNAFDARQVDMRPLVQVQAVGTTIAAKPLEVDLFIYRGGADVLAASVGTDVTGHDSTDRIGRGLGTRDQMAALNGTFLDQHILQQSGGCGTPAPDYVERYTLTYYGQKNNRQITVGGDYRSCPTPVREIFAAICRYLWQTIDSPIEYCAEPNPQ